MSAIGGSVAPGFERVAEVMADGTTLTVDRKAVGDFGTMVALRGTDIVRVPLAEATRELKTVPPERYAEAEVFFG